jgi:hypothetical protein
MPWSRPFEDPIPLPGGRQLVTLEDAAAYIMKLPKAEQDLEEWQTATGCLIGAAEGRDFVMHARIGMQRALNRTGRRARRLLFHACAEALAAAADATHAAPQPVFAAYCFSYAFT